MAENDDNSSQEHRLFVLTRPSRSEEVNTEALSDSLKQMLEEDFAARLGVAPEQFRANRAGTESTSQIGSGTQCFSSTETGEARDVTSDTTTDDPASTIVDDIHNDDSGTGGILDVPL